MSGTTLQASMADSIAQHPNYHFSADLQHISDLPVSALVQSSDCAFIADTLSTVPRSFRRELLDQYEAYYAEYQRDSSVTQSKARFTANQYFLAIKNSVKERPFLRQSDEGLRAKATRYARYVANLIGENHYEKGCIFAEKIGIDAPDTRWQHLSEKWQAAQDAEARALSEGKNPDHYRALRSQLAAQWQPIKARLVDEDWWIKPLIRKHDREFEKAAIHWGRVRKGKQLYVSDDTLTKIIARQQRSLKIMQGLVAVSDAGDEIEMLDVLKGSLANPEVKMAELMNRIYGFEAYAKEQGHWGEFYTFTAPSKYHANSHKYNGNTPREVQQQYFSPLWARIRAKLHNKGLNVYGFRIAEAHKDACTHWHVLLFMAKEQVVEVSNLLVDYAFREEGTEKGAFLSRFDWEEMNPKKGSAVSYIIKYISKNIAGLNLPDTDGNQISANHEGANRVAAWASVWGVRQFQQIGGSSISVWRELRRLGNEVQDDALVEEARKAANAGDWCAYLKVQDGINTPLKQQPIQLYRHPRLDMITGEAQTNQYGEVVESIQGIQTHDTLVITRLKQWTIQEKVIEDDSLSTESSDASITEVHDEAVKRLLGINRDAVLIGNDFNASNLSAENLDMTTALAFDLPWSSVINCRNPENPISKSNPKLPKKGLKTGENHEIHPKNRSKNAKKIS